MAAVSPELTLAGIDRAAEGAGLMNMGALHEGGATLVLLGPGAGFWELFRESPESTDGAPDPIDRWSRRVIGKLAEALGGAALFPFGGPPWHPFLAWALASGRAWQSPVGMLVHDTAGLMVSYRGALRMPGLIPLPAPPAARPCDTCPGRPCLTACPVGALGAAPYDVEACHAYLDMPAGQACMSLGCHVRRACPAGAGYARNPEQSAFHMRAFHPRSPR